MRVLLVVPLVPVLGCGTFNLGYATATRGQSQQEMDTAVLLCSREADHSIQTSGFKTAGFFSGFFFPLLPDPL